MTDQQLDQTIRSWLEAGAPREMPDRVLRATALRTRQTRQGGWRRAASNVPTSRMVASLGGVAAIVAIVVVGIVASNLPRSLDGPAAPLPTSPADWTRVEIERPAGAGVIRVIAAGPPGIVAVTGRGGDGKSHVFFSNDGQGWAESQISPAGEYVSVVATDRGFLMTVSEDGAWTSANGLEWQRAADDWSGDPGDGGAIVVDAAAGGPGYVAVGSGNRIWYSTDGSGWAAADVPPPPADLVLPEYPDLTADIVGVVSDGEHLVATGYYVAENSEGTGGSRDVVLASDDGRRWSTVLSDVGDRTGPLAMAAGPNGFLLIGGPVDGDVASTIWRSADGQTWQESGRHDFGSGVRILDAAATDAGFVAVGSQRDCDVCRSRSMLWTSPDGRSWSAFEGGHPFDLAEGGDSLETVSIDGARFVVGGQHRGRPAIWISGMERPRSTASPEPTLEAASDSPAPAPTTSEPPASGVMWPQSTLQEIGQAQERADAGDPAYVWQVDPRLTSEDWWTSIKAGGVQIVERFLRDELGWDQFVFNPFEPSVYPTEEGVLRVVYLRCSPGRTNTWYPNPPPAGHDEAPGIERCAPTIDESRFESVSLDIAQPGDQGRNGIWVVSRWETTDPFEQTDPVAAEADVTALLEAFLAARVAGVGAEGLVKVDDGQVADADVPLRYATTRGAPYERYEIDVVDGPAWPYGSMDLAVRLFADGGETVVEQPISWTHSPDGALELRSNAAATTENGEPVAIRYAFLDGQVTAVAAMPWTPSWRLSSDGLTRDEPGTELIVLLGDPFPVACAQFQASSDADALAQAIRADPDLETTRPAAVRIGGEEGLSMDIAMAPGGSQCDRGPLDGTPGARIRVYLVDMPEGSALRTIAIAIVAPEARFDDVMAAAEPVIDSIEFAAADDR